MENVRISDVTIKQSGSDKMLNLSFKAKIELAKLLDKLGVSVIELYGIKQEKADMLLIKSIASAVKDAEVAVPVGLSHDSADKVWDSLKGASRPRLQIEVPVSTVQMEYIYHIKPAKMLEAVTDTIKYCRSFTDNVEFVALDSTRSDREFLAQILKAAAESGAKTITIGNSSGNMLPVEFAGFIDQTKAEVPELENVVIGVSCSDELYTADSCSMAAIGQGAREVKCAAYPINITSLEKISKMIAGKGDVYNVSTSVSTVRIGRTISQVKWICSPEGASKSPYEFSTGDNGEVTFLSCHDNKDEVIKVVKGLGYDLSPEDEEAVWEAFQEIAGRKESISSKEIDALVASAAMQVPATYKLKNYIISTGNHISAMANIQLTKNGELLEGLGKGDGPIDAVFLALEQIAGKHYELDEFQIRSITEGREAMGETVVRLMSDGKLYSGRGLSTDVLASSIQAYLNALNKIAYEEAAE